MRGRFYLFETYVLLGAISKFLTLDFIPSVSNGLRLLEKPQSPQYSTNALVFPLATG
nr:MAG TPA: hypothetical protein [Caudoviricetes sp.]